MKFLIVNPRLLGSRIQRGFTLVEVLVAVIILAIGLLGLASLQARGLGNNQSAYNRSQATQLAYDIADKIRANDKAKNNYDSTVMSPSAATCDNPVNYTCMDCSSSGSTCSPTEMAERDLYEWNRAIQTVLPLGGRGQITVDDELYTVTISWIDDKENNATQNFATSFRF